MVGFDEFCQYWRISQEEILELLTKEPHYALQLSDLLNISQQAVVKHLDILEEAGFVSVEEVPSEAVLQKVYRVTESYCLRLVGT